MSTKESQSDKRIAESIFHVRGQRVLLDSVLSQLYGVELRSMLQAVRRNRDRFPSDFAFQLTKNEFDFLRSHFVILEKGRGKHRKYLPFVFTEQGIAMLSSVLKSRKAIHVNVAIMRTFVRIREMLSAHKELNKQIEQLERKVGQHDSDIQAIFAVIKKLIISERVVSPRRQIGFKS